LISEFECDLLTLVGGELWDDDYKEQFLLKHNYEFSKENIKFLDEFDGLFITDIEDLFVVYEYSVLI